jgi:glycosyltransferase involved in cell wall biosynthesis
MTPLISIIVPCYKVEKYLDRCVESITRQTYSNLEIILVDDGSPDRTGNMCDDWSKKDSRIVVIHKENGGLSDARNVAIDIAKGTYLTFVDSDDYVTHNYVEVLYQAVFESGADVSVASYKSFKEGDIPDYIEEETNLCLFEPVRAVEIMFYQNTFETSAWAKLYHRSLFANGLRYSKGWLYEDLALTYLLLLNANRVVFIDKVIYFYLIRADSIEGQSFNANKSRSAVNIIESIESNIKSYPSLKRAAQCRLLSLSLHVLKNMPEDIKSEDRTFLLKYIRKNRCSVLFNSRARFKARLASLLSYFSFLVLNRISAKLSR